MSGSRIRFVLVSLVALVLVACGGTGGVPDPDPETTWLLVSDYDGAKVQVLSTTGSLDAEGALWAGNETQVARVMGPSSGTGPRTLAPTRVVTYTTTGANDGGGMTFVPIPTGLGF